MIAFAFLVGIVGAAFAGAGIALNDVVPLCFGACAVAYACYLVGREVE